MTAGFRVVATSHVGAVRRGNEDAGLASTQLVAVADGMGGHAAGEVASAAVIQSLANAISDLPQDSSAAHDWIVSNINEAHGFLSDLIVADKERQGMGTTLSLITACEDRIVMGHIGDSRVYRMHERNLKQISTDHTYVQTLVDSGEITLEQAATHPRRNLLMRAIDGVHEVVVDVRDIDLVVGDRFLLCSDGLTGVLDDDTLAELLGHSDLTWAAAQMIEYALAAGAPDNVTVALAEVVENPPVTAPFMVGCASSEKLSAAPAAIRRRIFWKVLTPVFAVLLSLFVTNAWLENQWYVKSVNDSIYIYQGIPQGIGPIELSRVVEEANFTTSALTLSDQIALDRGITARSLADAQRILREIGTRTSP